MGAITNSIENFEIIFNQSFLDKAESLKPCLEHRIFSETKYVRVVKDGNKWITTEDERSEPPVLGKEELVTFDFGTHMVGNISFTMHPVGSPPDAPTHIRIKLGEKPCELGEDSERYQGNISGSWIQEEFLHIDVLPTTVTLPRRYAFRYLEIKVLNTSPKYKVVIDHVKCDAVTSAEKEKLLPRPVKLPEIMKRLDDIALKTMEECTQDVFEDGPKRDRRLWIGDLRLQAQVTYLTFQNTDLVKRCLYLFAGAVQNEGRVGACVFTSPNVIVDDTSLFDYSLFFISCLYDYYMQTSDMETLTELCDTAFRQIELLEKQLDHNGLVTEAEGWWCFLDWNDKLNKQAGAQGVFIYALRQAICLAEILHDKARIMHYQLLLGKVLNAAEKYLWDNQIGYYISGNDKQVSYASQVWMILAGVPGEERSQDILLRLCKEGNEIKMVTPYMHHHFVEALMKSGLYDEAFQYITTYWGKMVDDGADCFYEIFDPECPGNSPYGSPVINSYCHAWSCGPAYFIRKYWNKLSQEEKQSRGFL